MICYFVIHKYEPETNTNTVKLIFIHLETNCCWFF